MSGTEVSLALSVFLACAVEAVEAFTIVLAVGSTRRWSSALAGVGVATLVLAVLIGVLGPAITSLPIGVLRVVVGGLLLTFGLQWLRKAIMRAAGAKAKHDEEAIFARGAGRGGGGHRRGRGLRRLRLRDLLQSGAAGGPRGRLHRPHLRRQPARRRARRGRGRGSPSWPCSPPGWRCGRRWRGCRRTG